MSKKFCNALVHRTLIATVALMFLVDARATEVCSAPTNLDVPATSEGLYVNLVSGVWGPSEGSVPGFDINIYAAVSTDPTGQLRFYWGPESTGGAGVASTGDIYAVLGGGETIDAGSLFTRAAFTGDTSAWQAGVSGFLGMRFRDESQAMLVYGWMLLSTTATLGFPLTIEGWCYEDSGAGITTHELPTDVVFANGFDP